MDREERMKIRLSELCATFPALRGMEGTAPWDADRLATRWHTASGGERAAICFVLNVWNHHARWHCGPFTMNDFSRLDEDNRAAFVAWAREPWWA